MFRQMTAGPTRPPLPPLDCPWTLVSWRAMHYQKHDFIALTLTSVQCSNAVSWAARRPSSPYTGLLLQFPIRSSLLGDPTEYWGVTPEKLAVKQKPKVEAALNAVNHTAMWFLCEEHRRQLVSTPTIAVLWLSPKADTHFTVPRRVEGWVNLGTTVRCAARVCSPCPRLYFTVAKRFNPQTSSELTLDHREKFIEMYRIWIFKIRPEPESAEFTFSNLDLPEMTRCQTSRSRDQNLVHSYKLSCQTVTNTLILETGLPLYLSQQLLPYAPTRGLHSSSSKLLQVPRTNLWFGSRSFCVSTPTIWNSIPHSVRSCKSRKHLKTLYFQLVFSAAP